MPRKAFVADLQEAVRDFKRVQVSDLQAGEEDGMIAFAYHLATGDTVEVTVMVPDLGEYPSGHEYLTYTNSSHVPQQILDALDSMDHFPGVKVPKMLSGVVKTLDKATTGSQSNPVMLEGDVADDPMIIDSDDEAQPESESDDGFGSEDDAAWNQGPHQVGIKTKQIARHELPNLIALNERTRVDLSLAKNAGFRVSCLGSLLDGGRDGIVCLSIRVNRLGISEEAVQAWHIEPAHYFVLLIRYTEGYIPLDRMTGTDMAFASQSITFKVGLHKRYKPTLREAIDAFAVSEKKAKTGASREGLGNASKANAGLDNLFIGRPLEDLLNQRLLALLRYRSGMHLSWQGAEKFFNDHQGQNLDSNSANPEYWAEDVGAGSSTLPPVVKADHYQDAVDEKSFPLVAMQFALRHLVRCTEFCLVCHCRTGVDFEALKPYVCSKPLCLYQYMNLGFGPSIEHEIITQPHVVDLLISFCYASAAAKKLRYLPTGMALLVPGSTENSHQKFKHISTSKHFPLPGASNPAVPSMSKMEHPARTYNAKFDVMTQELLFRSGERPPLQIGCWIAYSKTAGSKVSERYHARVEEVLFPTVRLSAPIRDPQNTTSDLNIAVSTSGPASREESSLQRPRPLVTPQTSSTNLSSPLHEIDFVIYDHNFDEINDFEKQVCICDLLDTLPSVADMKQFLLKSDGPNKPLQKWKDRISPAALGVLRWIIASNRSCIIQIDSLDGNGQPAEDRVSGMKGWMQFRFAQGAPDKEQRFIASVQENTSLAKHPTMFAWHGSPLPNWHGIVREGLHFEFSDHGRAYGNGVYHALDVSTSLGYSNSMGRFAVTEPDSSKPVLGQWPFSRLKVSSAVVLNEIVNAPDRFVSRSPHLVVAQLDWIQARYLFVSIEDKSIKESKPTLVHQQDPNYTPFGHDRQPVCLPITAVSRSRRASEQAVLKSGNKKLKIGVLETPPEDVLLSEDTDVEDSLMFFPTEEEQEARKTDETALTSQKQSIPSKRAAAEPPKTDFVPGTHDIESLPLIQPPAYATSAATRTLQRELTSTLKIQDSHPIHELGWYIDREMITNVYQWILELHSFEASLPLAQELKAKDLKSVVLEIRFGKDYPMSPPFVRVIRPRFLSFNEGGGGHVTAGGALCMELLTNSGWSAVSNIESVLLQVRMAMSSTDPRPARLARGPVKDYGVGEAVEAYIRACNMHGWQVPPDFQASYGHPSKFNSF